MWYDGDKSYHDDSQTYTYYTTAKDTFDKGSLKTKIIFLEVYE